MRPVPYLLKVASGEVRPRYKVVPLNETKNFCLKDISVGLHLLAGHRSEVRRFAKECVRPFLMVRTKTGTNIKCVSVFVEIRCPGLMVLTDPESVRGIGSYLKTNTISGRLAKSRCQ